MQKKLQFILDIGTSTLRLLATTKFAGKPRIFAEESVLYDGYMDGEFLSVDDLQENLSTLIDSMSTKLRKKITSVVVGVPNEFCLCVCKRISRKYVEPHKIKEQDIVSLYNANADFGASEEYKLINFSSMQFVLDETLKTLSPIGKKANSLVLDASYILAKQSFIKLMIEKFSAIGIEDVGFISTMLGQAMVCEKENNSGKPIAIVDVGHISTSVGVYKGEGMALMSSFAMGGGHISSDIMQILDLNFRDAELVKRKVILTVESDKNESYEICAKGNLIKAPINMTNQIVKSRIEMIAKIISNILSINDAFKGIDIYLTGDGIANFKGVKNILKDVIGLNVYEFKIPFDNSKNKFQTSKIGLAALASSIE